MAHFCQAVMLLASLSWYLSFPASSGLADAVEPGLIPQHPWAPSSPPSFLGSVRDFFLCHQPALKSWHRDLWSIINACSCTGLTNSYNWYQPVSSLIYVLPENFLPFFHSLCLIPCISVWQLPGWPQVCLPFSASSSLLSVLLLILSDHHPCLSLYCLSSDCSSFY